MDTSFLLRPLVHKQTGKGRDKLDKNGKPLSRERYNEMGRMTGDVSTESASDEDFGFMEKTLEVKGQFDELE